MVCMVWWSDWPDKSWQQKCAEQHNIIGPGSAALLQPYPVMARWAGMEHEEDHDKLEQCTCYTCEVTDCILLQKGNFGCHRQQERFVGTSRSTASINPQLDTTWKLNVLIKHFRLQSKVATMHMPARANAMQCYLPLDLEMDYLRNNAT